MQKYKQIWIHLQSIINYWTIFANLILLNLITAIFWDSLEIQYEIWFLGNKTKCYEVCACYLFFSHNNAKLNTDVRCKTSTFWWYKELIFQLLCILDWNIQSEFSLKFESQLLRFRQRDGVGPVVVHGSHGSFFCLSLLSAYQG